jgi:hypothetical protein
MSERRPIDFLIAVVATLVILGLLFALFLVWVTRASQKFDDGKRGRTGTAHRDSNTRHKYEVRPT